jgi:hypothetical protein
MAGFVGLAVGAASQALGRHFAQKQQNEQMHQMLQMKTYMDTMHQDPTVINNPEFVKGFKKLYGEGADDFITSIKPIAAQAMRERAQQQDIMKLITGAKIGMSMNGGGTLTEQPKEFNQAQDMVRGGSMPNELPSTSIQGPGMTPSMPSQAPAPAPQAAPQVAPSQPVAPPAPAGLDDLNKEQAQMEQAQAALDSMKFASEDTKKGYAKIIDRHLKEIDEKRKALMAPITAAAESTARTSAARAVNYSPEAIAQDAKKSGAMAASGEAARIGVENSPAAIAGDVKRATALEAVKAKAAATDKPWTPKDALQARNAASTDAKRELSSSTLFGMKSTTPDSASVKKKTDQNMLSLGLLPNGQRMSDSGARAIFKDNQPVAYILNGKRIDL